MVNLKLENTSHSQKANEILENTKKGLGFVPNMYERMAKNTALLDAYTYSYASFRANSGFSPVEQEVIFLSVAYENDCEYCVAAHSFVGDKMTMVPKEVTDAIREGRQIPDPKLRALSKLTRILTSTRGFAPKSEIDEFIKAGYSEVDVLGVIAGIGVKTMSNYSNHNTKPSLDEVFKEREWKKI